MSQFAGVLSILFIVAALVTSLGGPPPQAQEATVLPSLQFDE